jgi:hypothetical protein
VSAKPTDVGTLARRLAAMTDAAMRVTYLRHELRKLEIPELAELLSAAKTAAESHDPRYAELLLSMSLALADESCAEIRRALVVHLDAEGETELSNTMKEAIVDVDEHTYRVPDFGIGRSVTLGERKSLARRNDRNMIARVLRDPHPAVIRILLENPGLTELDVVRLCARRPIVPEIQREVFRNRRWIARYRVKTAVVLNPNTPLDVALQVAPHLNKQDLRRVVASEDLPLELRELCKRRAGGKRGKRNDGEPSAGENG